MPLHAQDFTHSAMEIESAIAEMVPGWKHTAGPFGEDITQTRTGEGFEVKSHSDPREYLKFRTSPNEARHVRAAIERKAWVCLCQNDNGKPAKLLWFRANEALPVSRNRIRKDKGGILQERLALKFDPRKARYTIPEELF